ncbi:MAG: acyl-ACP thioesterase domain-containing protein [Acidimicrobiales bacterium]
MEPPSAGRIFEGSRRVRLSDVRPSGRLRLDAVARYLQDVAADDVADAGIEGEVAWVVRRTVIVVTRRPRYNDELRLATWCSGTGAAWAERRTTISVSGSVAVETCSLWASLDPVAMRPVPLAPSFFEVYPGDGPRRRVGSRLVHPAPTGPSAARTPWPLRVSDLDLLGHVNNAVAWAAIEEWRAGRAVGDVVAAEMEYRSPVDAAGVLLIESGAADSEGIHPLWLRDGSTAVVSARVRTRPVVGAG